MTKTTKKSLLLGVSAAAVFMSVAMSSNPAMAAAQNVDAELTLPAADGGDAITFNLNDGVLITGKDGNAVTLSGSIAVTSGKTGSTISAGENTQFNISANLGATGTLKTNAKAVTVSASNTVTVGTAEIGAGSLTVTGTLAAETATFTGDGTLTISATTGTATALTTITTATDGEGTVVVNNKTGVGSELSYGTSSKKLKALTFTHNAQTFTLDGDVYAATVTLGAGTGSTISAEKTVTATTVNVNTGTLTVAGTLAAPTVNFAGNGTLTISGTATALTAITTATTNTGTVNFNNQAGMPTEVEVGTADNKIATVAFNDSGKTFTLTKAIYATTTTISDGTTVQLNEGSSINGKLQGAADGKGALVINSDQTIAGVVGGDSKALASITVNEGATLTTSETVTATAITLSGATSTLKAAEKVTGAIDGAGIYQATDSHETGGIIGGTTQLAEIIVDTGKTLTAKHKISAAKITLTGALTIGEGGSYTGAINGSAANTGTLNVQAKGAVETGGVIGGTFGLETIAVSETGTNFSLKHNVKAANITVAENATLTIASPDLSIDGAIKGAVAQKGTLNINANFTSMAVIGAARLAAINVDNGATFTAKHDFDADAITVKNGATIKIGAAATSANGSVTVKNGGIFDLGENAYTATAGDFTAEEGSTVKLKLTGDGGATTPTENCGTITAANVTLAAGSKVEIDAGSQLVKGGHKYQLAIATNTATVPESLPIETGLITWTVAKDDKKVVATAAVKEMKAVEGIQGTRLESVATAVGNAINTKPEFRSLQNLTAQDLVAKVKTFDAAASFAAVQSISSVTSGAQASIDANAGSTAVAVADLTGVSGSHGHAVAAGNVVPAAAAVGAHGLEAWGQLMGSTEDQSRRKTYDGFKANTYALTLGVTGHIADGLKAGMAFTYADADIKEKLNASKTDAKNYMLSLYGAFSPLNTWFVDGVVTGGSTKQEAKRVDLLNTTYNSETSAATFSAKVKGGWNVKVGDGMLISPFVAIKGGTTKVDGYTEKGGSNPMTVAESRMNSFQAGLGANVAMTTGAIDGWTMTPSFNVSFMHEFNAKSRTVKAQWIGSDMQVKTPEAPSEIIAGGLGLTAASDTGASVSLNYTCTAKSSNIGHAGTLRVGYSF